MFTSVSGILINADNWFHDCDSENYSTKIMTSSATSAQHSGCKINKEILINKETLHTKESRVQVQL